METTININDFKNIIDVAVTEALAEVKQYIDARVGIANDPERPLGVREAAAFLGISTNTLYRLTSEGRITYHKSGAKHGGRVVFNRAELVEWIWNNSKAVPCKREGEKQLAIEAARRVAQMNSRKK